MASAAQGSDGLDARQIFGLDLIRFLAAFLVMAYHLAFATWAGDGIVARIMDGTVDYPALASWSWFGWIGVEIFFTLSAIVICISAERKDAKGFAINRFVRLYPAAWICATISLVALALTGQSDLLERYLRSLLLFPSGPWVDDVYWTLAFEIAFYALVFLLLLFGAFRRLPLALGLLGAASSFYWGLWWADRLGEPGPWADPILSFGLGMPLRFLIGFGCYFAAGGFLWLGVRQGWSKGRLAMLALCVAGCLLRIFFRAELIGEALGMRFEALIPAAIWSISVLLMAASLIWNEAATRRWGGHEAAFRAIGLATYPLYLLHAVVGATILLGLREAGVAQGPALAAAIGLIVTLSFAIALLLERPFQALVKAGLQRALGVSARPGGA